MQLVTYANAQDARPVQQSWSLHRRRPASSPFTDALPPVLTPIDGCCSSGSLTRSPHRGRTASSIECPFRTRAAQAESTRQRSARPLSFIVKDTRRASHHRGLANPAGTALSFMFREHLEMSIPLCIFAFEGGKEQVYFSCYEKVGYRLSLG